MLSSPASVSSALLLVFALLSFGVSNYFFLVVLVGPVVCWISKSRIQLVYIYLVATVASLACLWTAVACLAPEPSWPLNYAVWYWLWLVLLGAECRYFVSLRWKQLAALPWCFLWLVVVVVLRFFLWIPNRWIVSGGIPFACVWQDRVDAFVGMINELDLPGVFDAAPSPSGDLDDEFLDMFSSMHVLPLGLPPLSRQPCKCLHLDDNPANVCIWTVIGGDMTVGSNKELPKQCLFDTESYDSYRITVVRLVKHYDLRYLDNWFVALVVDDVSLSLNDGRIEKVDVEWYRDGTRQRRPNDDDIPLAMIDTLTKKNFTSI
ncbi:hypothetical protein BCR42DRAFT_395277 [Absidia repens]|uniref:Uncharacterized protein n=1 Tax=Absidia repens TaxID=90262 RepID=A0A1X2I8J4_9FUNG|nr:hypothetical protein BCR42DRAFT_395277 [Absidia repens]